MKRPLALYALVVLVLGVGLPALASSAWAQGQDINDMIANAKSPADHEAIAAYYDKAATAAEASAEQHKKMAETYAKLLRPDHPSSVEGHLKPLPAHCKAEAKYYEGIATENRALAAAHRKMAQGAPK
jgi:hypothetical protein